MFRLCRSLSWRYTSWDKASNRASLGADDKDDGDGDEEEGEEGEENKTAEGWAACESAQATSVMSFGFSSDLDLTSWTLQASEMRLRKCNH